MREPTTAIAGREVREHPRLRALDLLEGDALQVDAADLLGLDEHHPPLLLLLARSALMMPIRVWKPTVSCLLHSPGALELEDAGEAGMADWRPQFVRSRSNWFLATRAAMVGPNSAAPRSWKLRPPKTMLMICAS